MNVSAKTRLHNLVNAFHFDSNVRLVVRLRLVRCNRLDIPPILAELLPRQDGMTDLG
jgi:hypothetical protein